MKLNRTDTMYDREARNKENENWATIENNFNNVVQTVSDKAYGEVVDAAKLNWKEPVSSFANLPTTANEGDTMMTRDTGKVYRYNGTEFKEIQQIDAGPVNEVDSRLTSQLAENQTELETLETIKMDKNTHDIGINQINKNKGLIDETYISDTLKQQITGTTPIHATPADYSITTNKLAFNPVLGTPSKNLFNKETITSGYRVSSATGELVADAEHFSSDFIPVEPNTEYVRSPRLDTMAFYDENKAYISGLAYDATVNFITPSNTRYVRVSDFLTNLDIYQLEKGNKATPYAPFGASLDGEKIQAFSGNKIKDKTIEPNKFTDFVLGKNLFDKDKAVTGKVVESSTGKLADNVDYFTSDYIKIEPNTEYVRQPRVDVLAFYDENKVYISGLAYGVPANFVTPSNAKYIRLSAYLTELDTFQLEKGAVQTSYEPYYYKLPKLKTDNMSFTPTPSNRIYTFNDAWVAWNNGEKFPVAFYGDSTTAGATTTDYFTNTIGTDYIVPNAYPKLTEDKLRAETGSTTLRIYNAGFAGENSSFGVNNIEGVFGSTSAYSDVKMVGIGFGINDRTGDFEIDFRTNFKNNNIQMIEWCFSNGIQPFLLTTQAVFEPEKRYDISGENATQYRVETVANEVKKELANEFGISLIDINHFTENFLNHSMTPMPEIMTDDLHFTDAGHKYESGLMFAEVNPYVIWVKDKQKLTYLTQSIVKGLKRANLTTSSSGTDQFKVYANYVKGTAEDELIYKVIVFNESAKQLNLKAYKSIVESLTYVKINGVTTTLDALEKTIATLDLGLHILEVWTGASAKVDFKGFIIE